MKLSVLLKPTSMAATAIILGALIKVASSMLLGTLPIEATDSLSQLGNLLLYPGLVVWLSFAALSFYRNVRAL